ncbi:MAG: hypothetical protein H6606_10625 [Flavobacteriales bacterium]|nr:hypothetical protein [Flavobacteriales bacterium]
MTETKRHILRRILFVLLGILVLTPAFRYADTFLDSQLQYGRVKQAFELKQDRVRNMLLRRNVNPEGFELYLRAFKEEGLLEVWARNKGTLKFEHIIDYPFCQNIGFPGPKRRRADGQIPEGMYKLIQFNPFSDYHLSLKINYPNQADRNREGDHDLGGMIFIHGGCSTIGCIPITDDKIRELYIMAVLATDQGQKEIDVHIFPNILDRECYMELASSAHDKELVKFWGNLRTSIVFFNRYQYPPIYSIDGKGVYHFKQP